MDVVDIVVISLIAILTVGYFALMVFFPEWVGMSGKVAKKNRDEHKENIRTKTQEPGSDT